jgi:hypothetical protein
MLLQKNEVTREKVSLIQVQSIPVLLEADRDRADFQETHGRTLYLV